MKLETILYKKDASVYFLYAYHDHAKQSSLCRIRLFYHAKTLFVIDVTIAFSDNKKADISAGKNQSWTFTPI